MTARMTAAEGVPRRGLKDRGAWTSDLEADGRGVIEEALDREGLVLHAQPVVDLFTGKTVQHELLVRLQLDGELIPPQRFLPYAEGCELIRRIDDWVLDRGIGLARNHPVAINLSAKSIEDPGIAEYVERCFLEAGTDPANVVFEITETAAMSRVETASCLVDRLTRMGCRFVLDDFGIGYGSFTYLKHLAVSALKIDMDFVRGLLEHPGNQRVVRAIISVADAFDLQTVAEGVEDQQTLEVIRAMGVDFAQGYHLGAPAPSSFLEQPARSLRLVEA